MGHSFWQTFAQSLCADMGLGPEYAVSTPPAMHSAVALAALTLTLTLTPSSEAQLLLLSLCVLLWPPSPAACSGQSIATS